MVKKRSKKKKKSTGKRTRSKDQSTLNVRSLLPYILAVALVTLIAMFPVINADFTEIDDKALILEKAEFLASNPAKVWKQSLYSPHYKPLVKLSWAIEASLFGLDAKVFHIDNLILHIVNCILVFLVCLRLANMFPQTRKRPELVATATAMLYGVHPMHVESVAWAVERKDVLYTFFFLIGLLLYMRHQRTPGLKWMLLTALFFLASILSKAPGIVFPFVLFLLDYAADKKWSKDLLIQKWPIYVIFVAGLIMFGVFGGSSGGGGGGTEGSIANMMSERPVTRVQPVSDFPAMYAKVALLGLKGVFWYVHTLIPAKLSIAYPYKQWIPAIGHLIHILPLLLAAFAYWLFRVRKTKRFIVFTNAFFFVALGPALIRTGLGKSIFLSDRYVYLASLGLILLGVGLLVNFLDKKGWDAKKQFIVFGALTLVYGLLCFSYARKWDNGETLWTNVIDKYPRIAYAYVNRALYYKGLGDTNRAFADFNSALEIEDDSHALVNRGTMLRDMGRYQEALADFDRLLATKPNDEYGLNGKANVLFTMGRYQEAVDVYSLGLSMHPRAANFYTNRSAAYYYLGQIQLALQDLAKAQQIRPGYPGINQKRTVMYMSINDWENAVVSSRLTAREEPGNHANYGDMGKALYELGRYQEAIDAYTRAISIFSKGKRYYQGRAKCYSALGNSDAAKNDRQIARSL